MRVRRQRHSAVPFCLPPRFSPQHADINHREDVALTDSWISQHAHWEKTSFFSISLQQIPTDTACTLILKHFPGPVLYSKCFIMASNKHNKSIYDIFSLKFCNYRLNICFRLNYWLMCMKKCIWKASHCILSIIFVYNI